MRTGCPSLFLAIFLGSSLCAWAQTPAWVVGYYDPGYQQLCDAKDLPFSQLSLATVNVNVGRDGHLKSDEGAKTLLADFPKLAHAAGCRAILGILGHETFPPQMASAPKRNRLAAEIASWVKRYGYDGADVDWESPKSENDKTAFVAFSRELRKELSSPRYLLTFDVSNSPAWDFPALSKIYALIQLMAYDLHGSWSEHAGHNAPLYLDPRDKNGDWDESLSVDLETQWALQAGAPREKLVLGVPFYGHGFSEGLYVKRGKGEKASYLPYQEIQRDWAAKGWERRWDKDSHVPYLVNPNKPGIVSYDDPESLRAKCRYALSKGLAGVMIYAVGYDREPSSGRQPLMEAVSGVLKARR